MTASALLSAEQSPLHWYAAIVVHRIAVTPRDGASGHDDDYAGALVLVRATSEERAMAEAERLARAEEDEYENADGEKVNWRFVEILDVRAVGARLRSGREVYSWIMSEDAFATLRAEYDSPT